MITSVAIHNFKIHKDSVLDLAPLTILTGINGMGKSSVTQPLLLLREAFLSMAYPTRLPIKNNAVDLGLNVLPLLNWRTEKNDNPDLFEVKLVTDNSTLDFRFKYPMGNATEWLPYPGCLLPSRDVLECESLFNGNFQYISAFRNGPQAKYYDDSGAVDGCQISLRNGNGEYAVAILERFGTDLIPVKEAALPYKQSPDDELRLDIQTTLWLGRIAPGIRYKVDVAGSEFSLSFLYPVKNTTKQVSPLNTGYGISYILPLIVALLITPPGGIVVIENPEAHIHPAGQSALMELISRVAQNGVQVIIETHSDHIIYGPLVNMKRGVIENNNLAIIHFDSDTDGALTMQNIKIGPDCRIKNPPPHFVEQMNLDLDVLFDY